MSLFISISAGHTMTSFYTHKTSIFFMRVQAYAAHEAGGKLEPFEYELGSLKPDEVEIDVKYCGICHSDLSMLKNEWGLSIHLYQGTKLSVECLRLEIW